MSYDETRHHQPAGAFHPAVTGEFHHDGGETEANRPGSRRSMLKGLGAIGALGALATVGTTAADGLINRQAAVALPPSGNAPGQVFFVAIEGTRTGVFPGTVQRRGQGWIEGFAFELANAVVSGGGRVDRQLAFRLVSGASTPRLLQAITTGELLQMTIELTELGSGAGGDIALRVVLDDAVIQGLRTVIDEPGAGPASSLGVYDQVDVAARTLSMEHPGTSIVVQA